MSEHLLITGPSIRAVESPVVLESLDKSVAGAAPVTLAITEYCYPVLRLYGALTGSIDVILPLPEKGRWIVYNNTTGAYTLRAIGSAGTGVYIPQGSVMVVRSDGTNILADSPDSLVGRAPTLAAGAEGVGDDITVTITVAGLRSDERRLVRVWLSDTSFGAPTAVPPDGAVTIDPDADGSGVQIEEITAKTQWVIEANQAGVAKVKAIESTAKTFYLMASDGGRTSAVAMTYAL